MQDRPTAPELLEATLEFLQHELLPTVADSRTRFRLRVAINALSILGRDLEQEERHLREEYKRLSKLLSQSVDLPSSTSSLREQVLALNWELSVRIRRQDVPDGTMEHLKQTLQDKLAIASPNYLRRFDT